ncbi:MAG: UDP-N-acetylglucosamine 2-epimerase [Proteobacteria bacterium]|nr:UDP-N-acetylglucosamine 2-epimerase [Pseudomonadota bacterium]
MTRTVAVFTGNRAEYGLQLPILRAIHAHPDLEYRLVVSGAHLDPDFGRTRAEIEADGITIHEEVEIRMDESVPYATPQAIGTGVVAVARALVRLAPDLFVVYADRFEGFAAVIAATQMSIPTAHVEGGDRTEGGALDDSVRHAMTKLAHLHFTTNEEATRRIVAMGEEPWRVHTVGFPAIDLIAAGNFTPADEVLARYGLDPARPLVVFTQHSVTTEFAQAAEQTAPALAALAELANDGVQVMLTYPNNDAGGRRIIAALEAFAADAPPGVQLHRSLGRANYHGLLALARTGIAVVCAGNSSSGIKETPAFGCPTVNIGSRQQGRLRAANVLDAGYDAAEIAAAIRAGLTDAAFRAAAATCENPYGTGDAGAKIAEVLATVPLGEHLIRKRMTLEGA